MERIVVNRSATLTKTFTFTPTGDPSVAVTRSDGTTVTTSAVSGTGTTWSYTIPASENTLLDTLTETWTATTSGEPQEFADTIEVAGGSLFTLAELTGELNSTESYTDAEKADARTYAETQIERACGQAFVPRYELETLSGTGTAQLMLKWPRVRSIRSFTIDDVAGTAADVAFRPFGHLYYAAGWTSGYGNVLVGYEHGQSYPPPAAQEAALVLAKHKLVKGPIDERATQRTSEFGPVNLATPGLFGSRFGIPVVDAFVQEYDMTVGVA